MTGPRRRETPRARSAGGPDRGDREEPFARAAVFLRPGRVEVRREPLPPQPGRLLVRSRLMGISHGTELLLFTGAFPRGPSADPSLRSLAHPAEYPLKYGYSNVGLAEDGRRLFAFFPHQDRFYCEEAETVPLPAEIPDEDAVFLPHMETALTLVHDAAPRYGEEALVVGQGTVGLLAAEILVRAGAGRVVCLDLHERRREASRRIGCLALDPAEPDLAARLLALTGGRGFDLAIDVSASAGGLQRALDALAFGGTVIAGSWTGSRPTALDLGAAFHRRRLAIRSSQVSTIDPALSGRWDRARRMGRVLDLLREVRPGKYITHRFRLEAVQEAFLLLRDRPEETIQVVLEP